jgi:iron complex outermembrane recepter protein
MISRDSVASLFLVSLLTPAAGFGQSNTPQGEPGLTLEEIVVTAQRREESLQKSSLAIQSVSGAELVAAGVTQPKDLNALVPGLQIATAGTSAQIFIRGVGDYSANGLSNPGVAFNVDGVYVGRPEAVGTSFYDVQRVEVVKGPQGTLYGRNASGGAINVITNKPSFDGFSGTALVEGGNYSLKHGQAALNVPLTDVLAMRIAADAVDRDGYMDDGSDDDKHEAGRVHLLFQPSEALSLLATVDYAHAHGKGAGFAVASLGQGPLPGNVDPWTSSQSAYGLASLALAADTTPPFSFIPRIPPTNCSILTCGMDFEPFIDTTAWNGSVELKYDLDFATLTVLPAYRHFENELHTFVNFSNSQQFTDKQSTIEARLNHDGDLLKWVAGLYYYDESMDNGIHIEQGLFQNGVVTHRIDTEAYAAFGQASFTVVDNLRLIAGARYTKEDRTMTGQSVNTFFPATVPTTLLFSGNYVDDSITWKGGVEFDISPENMLFFTASTGFKAGGINQEPAPNLYKPEELLAFELGSRNRFLDDRLQVNVEVFHWTYKDHQENTATIDNTGSLNFLTLNAGKATLYGANLDIQARVTQYDTLRANVEYNHSRYDEFRVEAVNGIFNPAQTGCSFSLNADGPTFPAGPHAGEPIFGTINCDDFQVARAPEWTASASVQHVFPLPNGAELVANLGGQYTSARWASVDFTAQARLPAYTIGNFDLTYNAGGRWSLIGFVRNFNNEDAPNGALQHSFVPPFTSYSMNAPRTYGGRFLVNF